MRRFLPLIFGVVAVVLAILIYSSAFIVDETEQAVVLQFGDPKNVIREPGLHFKTPLIQNIVILDKRILSADPTNQTILLQDNRRLIVDTFVRYKITDPDRFIRVVGAESILESRLQPIVNDALRGVLGDATLADVVSEKRAALMEDIRKRVADQSQQFGIDVVDLRINKADLAPAVAEAVYNRMRAERERLAQDFRSRGRELSVTIRAQADREARVIRAEAERQSDVLRGEGEAEQTRILNQAFSADPDFFRFYRSMQAYREAINNTNSSMVITTDSEFFRYFNEAGQVIGTPVPIPQPTVAPAPVDGDQDALLRTGPSEEIPPASTSGTSDAATDDQPATDASTAAPQPGTQPDNDSGNAASGGATSQ